MTDKKENQEHSYTKQQFISSKNYSQSEKDLLNALLEDGKEYTHTQVTNAIKEFLRQEVK